MSPPWMPLYIADYRADTAHLTAAEHGAYLLLIMHYWAAGSLPTDDKQLARIAAMTPYQWKISRPSIEKFFTPEWKHKRIEEELAKAGAVAAKYSERSKKAAGARWSKAKGEVRTSNALSMLGASQPQPQPLLFPSEAKASEGTSETEEARLFRRGRVVLGKSAGGLISDLLKAKGGNIALARAAIETASTKNNPREYIGGVIRGGHETRLAANSGWDPGL